MIDQLGAELSLPLYDGDLDDPEEFLNDSTTMRDFMRDDLRVQTYFVLMSLFIRQTYEFSFLELPLLSFSALKNFKPCGSIMVAGEASGFFSRLIYCCQLTVIGYVWAVTPDDADVVKQLQTIRETYMLNDTRTPLGELQSQRALAMHISRNEPSMPTTYWIDNDVIVHRDIRLEVNKLEGFVQSLMERAIKVWNRLVFDITVPNLDLGDHRTVPENISNRNAAYSGLTDARGQITDIKNQFLQKFMSKFFDKDLTDDENYQNLFTSTWITAYERTVEEFLGLILLLVHISVGPSARGSEILTTRYSNTQSLRNLFVYEGTILISICYHKAQNMTQQQRYVHRSLPPQLSQMVANFLVFVIPIRYLALWWSLRAQNSERSKRDITIEASQAPFLTYFWAKQNDRWCSSQLSDLLRKETVKYALPELSIQSWRQISVSITNRLFKAHSAAMDPEDDEFENDDDDSIGFEESDVWDQLASHSTDVADKRYGVRLDIGYAKNEKSLIEHVNACRAWQKWLKVDQHHQPSNIKIRASEIGSKRPRSESSALINSQPKRSLKTIAVQLRWSMTVVDHLLCRLFKTKTPEYRSPQQKLALEHIVTGTTQILAILPTGGGKSLLFQLPTRLTGARTTVVIVPFKALQDDIMEKTSNLGIPNSRWDNANKDQLKHNLIFASLEHVRDTSFHSFLQRLQAEQALDRIVLDECHLALTEDVSYRPTLLMLNQLRSYSVQMVCLTATLPITEEPRFRRLLSFDEDELEIVRAPTSRFNLKIQCTTYGSWKESQMLTKQALTNWSKHYENLDKRAVCFVNQTKVAEELSSNLECLYYHATMIKKEEMFNKWRAGSEPGHKVMVTTAALYQGVDLSNINYVVMLEPPSSIYHLIQAMGRGGRDGEQATILIIIPTTWRPRFSTTATTSQALLEEFLTTDGCRHFVLSKGMDNMMECCKPNEVDRISCDNCARSSAQAPPWFVGKLPPPKRNNLPLVKEIQYKTVATKEPSTSESIAQKRLTSGSNKIRKEKATQQEQLQNFKEGLSLFKNACSICDTKILLSHHPLTGPPLHKFHSCKAKFHFLDSRKLFFKLQQNGSCYMCCLPDEICGRSQDSGKCSGQYKDILLPLCWSVFWSPEYSNQLPSEIQDFDGDQFMSWLGKSYMFLGMRSCNAVRLAASVIAASSSET
ncbi:hypothetical protein AOL_s00054g994 [Orbilia oligospora ATCC 24927]|uniref:DNA 3'-5' helicase n=1 Tax=Arthrobotrys oligospora (strain ATCC 24927 / CBS 115.81 / DSM 1491) TaxID=756982 RepID=G1X800_ARTOA|nr:hypothetical protein AOL_s00054g994 [Orbilia oligospora ATCC 24927]EGX50726.1 hypothetical protein AOL_s00054g994 [Orbilia oligospora ATCC 24927]